MKKVLILGCGWVGEDLAVQLLKDGYQVWATTTQEDKAKRLLALGIQAVVVNFDQKVSSEVFPKTFDYVLTSVPASSRLDVAQSKVRFDHILSFLKDICYIKNIYLSSTGVYPDQDAVFTEEYSDDLNERLYAAEKIMLQAPNTIVYRLGGLFGKNRIFAKYFENRVCTTGDQLANFVHVDDVVQLIQQGFEQHLESNIYNIVAPEHPVKKDVIIASAAKYGFQLPSAFIPENSFQKLVDGSKVMEKLNYTFKYANPIDF